MSTQKLAVVSPTTSAVVDFLSAHANVTITFDKETQKLEIVVKTFSSDDASQWEEEELTVYLPEYREPEPESEGPQACYDCYGTGEGPADDTQCSTCHGKGKSNARYNLRSKTQG